MDPSGSAAPSSPAISSGPFARRRCAAILSPDDDRPAAAPVAVVTEYFWRTHLDGRDDAIGRPVLLGGTSFTVVGVAPPRFHGMQTLDPGQDDSNGVQAWIPRPRAAVANPPIARHRLAHRRRTRETRPHDGGRRAPADGLGGTHRRVAARPRANAAPRVRAHGFGPDDAPIEIFALVIALLALPLIVLAIGCANVANLHWPALPNSRASSPFGWRSGRAAPSSCDCSPSRRSRACSSPSVCRSGSSSSPSPGCRPMVPVFVSIDWRVLLFAVSLALGVSWRPGSCPRGSCSAARRPASSNRALGGGLRHSRLRGALIVGQVALSLGLMVLAGLFTRTSQAMVNEAPSALRQQMVATFDPSELRMTPLEARRFADTLAAGAAADGRVTHVALSIDDSVRFGLPSAPRTSDRVCVARRHDPRMGRRHGGQASHRPAPDRCGRPHDRHAEREAAR